MEIETEALFFAALIRADRLDPVKGLRREYFAERWQPVWDWLLEFTKTERKLPSTPALEQRFKVELAGVDIASEAPDYYARLLRDNALRAGIEAGITEKIAPKLEDWKPREALAEAKVVITDLQREFREADRGLVLADIADTVRDRLADYKLRGKLKNLTGVPTPFPTMTTATGGLRPGELWVLLARPNAGKTTVSCLFAQRLYESGFRVLYVSMETPPQGALPRDPRHRVVDRICIRCGEEDAPADRVCHGAQTPRQRLTVRFDAIGAHVSMWRLLRGELNPHEEWRLREYYRALVDAELHGWGSLRVVAAPVVSSVNDLEIEILEYQPDFVVWDSAYLAARPTGKKKQTEAAAEMVIDLKLMLERTSVPCLVTWHFNRDVAEKDDDASQGEAGLTDEIGKAGDVLIGMFRPPKARLANEAIFRTLKVRDGQFMRKLTTRFQLVDTTAFDELPPDADADAPAKDAKK